MVVKLQGFETILTFGGTHLFKVLGGHLHYGLKLTVSKFSNFPLLNPSQIAPKFYSLVEQCRAKNSTWVEADTI